PVAERDERHEGPDDAARVVRHRGREGRGRRGRRDGRRERRERHGRKARAGRDGRQRRAHVRGTPAGRQVRARPGRMGPARMGPPAVLAAGVLVRRTVVRRTVVRRRVERRRVVGRTVVCPAVVGRVIVGRAAAVRRPGLLPGRGVVRAVRVVIHMPSLPANPAPTTASTTGSASCRTDGTPAAFPPRRSCAIMGPVGRLPGGGLAKGLAVTLRTMTRRSITRQYPEVQPELPPRSRGVIALFEENCTVCMLCARECPDWCIYIDSHKETLPAEGGGRARTRNVLDRFAIDFALCMYCGICVEVCPFDALFWSPEFEYAEYDIAELTHEKERLREWMWTVPPPPAHDPSAEPP